MLEKIETMFLREIEERRAKHEEVMTAYGNGERVKFTSMNVA